MVDEYRTWNNFAKGSQIDLLIPTYIVDRQQALYMCDKLIKVAFPAEKKYGYNKNILQDNVQQF